MTETRPFLAWPGAPLALLSAALFGASTPFAKLLLGDGMNPWLLAALLYLGSGVGLGLFWLSRHVTAAAPAEAPLRRPDLPWLALAILFGGIAAPVLLLFGLALSTAASAALLLNLEGLATMAIAWVVFRESVDRLLLLGAAAILAGAVLLSWQAGALGVGLGAGLIALACLGWGIDNNLTRKLSAADPVLIALVKGLAAGLVNLALALVVGGAAWPGAGALVAALAVGFLGYGVSLALYVVALRHLGAARTGAYFATAPFIGAVLAVGLLDEPLTSRLMLAGLLMASGVALHLREAHVHAHRHEAMVHEHRHSHDAHHQHDHGAEDPPGEPHSHWHRHAPLLHAHPHYPDLHHRHDHAHSH